MPVFNRYRRAFTLVEVLIVFVVIGILSGTMMLTMGSGSDKARATRIVRDMKTLSRAAQMAYADGMSLGPDVTALSPYVADNLEAQEKYSLVAQDGYLFVKADLSDYGEGVRTRLSSGAGDWNLWQAIGEDSADIYTDADAVFLPVNLAASAEDSYAISLAFAAGYSADDFVSDFMGVGIYGFGGTDGNPGTWDVVDGEGLKDSGNGNYVFTDAVWGDIGDDYTITVTASMTGSGEGYGIYFRTTVDEEGNIVSGYRFQFDPGRNGGVFVIMDPRTDSPITTATEGDVESSFPSGFDYNAEHTIEITAQGDHFVVTVDAGTDSDFTALDFYDTTNTEGTGGLRGWGTGGVTTFSDITVDSLD